jgi:RNA 2',3'-cyclic 3'-phosphodiesterase
MAYFTALPVPPEVTQVLQTIRPNLKDANWTHPDDYHLTLKYYGEPSPDVLENIQQLMREGEWPALEIRPLKLHVFERPDRHFLVLRTERTAPLHDLHKLQEAAATAQGIAPYVFPEFIPHITLASYAPQSVDFSMFENITILAYIADKMTFYKSNKPHGTGVGRYQSLKHFPLITT